MLNNFTRRHRLGARIVVLGLTLFLLADIARVSGADPTSAEPERSVLQRIESLNPHLVDREIPNLSLKVMSLREGPYGFFRGTADLFYVWCKSNCADWLAASDTRVWLHGDVHPGNTGTYVAGPDGGPRLAYSLVDFDEVFEGPFELDLLRAATSLRFAAAENGLNLTDAEWGKVIESLMGAYRDVWNAYPAADIGGLRRDEALVRADELVLEHPIVKQLMAKAESQRVTEYVDDFTKGEPPVRFKNRRKKKKKTKDVMVRVDEMERDAVVAAFRKSMDRLIGRGPTTMLPAPDKSVDPAEVKVLDVVRWIRLGSCGSQGLRKYLVLVETRDETNGFPRIFQLKEEPACAAARAGIFQSPVSLERGQLVAESCVCLEWRPRLFVSWTSIGNTQFLMKPKDPFGKEPDTDDLDSREALSQMAALMGRLLGIGHAKSRYKADTTAIQSAIKRNELAEQIQQRSGACLVEFMKAYSSFRADARAGELADKAETWLKSRT